MTAISTDPHPTLRVAAFTTTFPAALERVATPEHVAALLSLDATAPLHRDEKVRTAIRDMLRIGGYKPTGRGKPASEYLVRSAQDGRLSPINIAVDACNAVSLHSGLPISVIDLDRAAPPFRIGIADVGERYVFNDAGQEIAVGGLLCLFDAAGACANPVRDSERTKTHGGTRHTLSVIWGCAGQEERLERAAAWYRRMLQEAGASCESTNHQETPASRPGTEP